MDGQDKYYRLRDLKRALPEVVVKVSAMRLWLDVGPKILLVGRADYIAGGDQRQGQSR